MTEFVPGFHAHLRMFEIALPRTGIRRAAAWVLASLLLVSASDGRACWCQHDHEGTPTPHPGFAHAGEHEFTLDSGAPWDVAAAHSDSSQAHGGQALEHGHGSSEPGGPGRDCPCLDVEAPALPLAKEDGSNSFGAAGVARAERPRTASASACELEEHGDASQDIAARAHAPPKCVLNCTFRC